MIGCLEAGLCQERCVSCWTRITSRKEGNMKSGLRSYGMFSACRDFDTQCKNRKGEPGLQRRHIIAKKIHNVLSLKSTAGKIPIFAQG